MGKFYQSIQSNGPSFMTKFCSALYLENLLTNIFAKLNLRGGVSCMPAALLFLVVKSLKFHQKCFDIFIFAQNIDCGYSLEPPRRSSQTFDEARRF